MKQFGIVEAGSTFTKSYVAHDTTVVQVGMHDIPFRADYRAAGMIARRDIEALARVARELSETVDAVHVFGTSIFREANENQLEELRRAISDLGFAFKVVTAEEEGEYTARGAMHDLDQAGNVAVMVGGGGSTEVFVFSHGTVVEKALSPIGVGDVNHVFPDLSMEIATTAPPTATQWIARRLAPVDSKADLLVLAGGNFPLLYLNAGYNLMPNDYSLDPNKPYMLRNADKNARDVDYFFSQRLSDLRVITPDTPGWWDGTRAMCCVVAAVADQLNASTLIPTSISMVYGLLDMLQGESGGPETGR